MIKYFNLAEDNIEPFILISQKKKRRRNDILFKKCLNAISFTIYFEKRYILDKMIIFQTKKIAKINVR